jgi:hypothetical protein
MVYIAGPRHFPGSLAVKSFRFVRGDVNLLTAPRDLDAVVSELIDGAQELRGQVGRQFLRCLFLHLLLGAAAHLLAHVEGGIEQHFQGIRRRLARPI